MRPLVALAVMLVASPALAQEDPAPDPMRLDYTSAPRCVDAATFRHMVATRLLGKDPFTTDAPELLVIKLHRRGPAFFVADLSIYDPAGQRTQHRELTEPDCTAVAEGAAFVVGGWLRPLVFPVAKKAPEVPPPAAVGLVPVVVAAPAAGPPRCEPAPAPASQTRWEPPSIWAPPDAKTGLGFRIGAAVWGERFAVDGGALGFTVDAGVRYGWFSAALEVHGDPPLGSASTPFDRLSGARVTGALLPCLHYGYLAACGKAEAGGILFPGASRPAAARAYGAAGLRLNLEFPTGAPSLFLRLSGEVLFAIDPANVVHFGRIQYATVGTGGGLGLGLLYAR